MTTAVIYHYYELNKTYKDNFIFFLNTAINDDAHYFIFISGTCSIDLPNLTNVDIHFIENKNNDFGAVLAFHKLSKLVRFDNYVFINSSSRGPFLASYFKNKWYEAFTSQLSDRVGLVGSSINLLHETAIHSIEFENRHNFDAPYIHVQTNAYAISAKCYKVLENHNFFDEIGVLDKHQVISDYEILMSQILMKSGFIITSLIPPLTNFSSRRKSVEAIDTSRNGDVLYKSAFYGRTLSPIECVFVKTNRNMISDNELCSHTFTALQERNEQNGLDANGLDLLTRVTDFDKKLKLHWLNWKVFFPISMLIILSYVQDLRLF